MINIKNLLEVLFAKILILFRFKFDKSKIPEGLYCYSPNSEKNNNKPITDFIYYVNYCIYYKNISKEWNACKYLGKITNDFIFADSCKICNQNDDWIE